MCAAYPASFRPRSVCTGKPTCKPVLFFAVDDVNWGGAGIRTCDFIMLYFFGKINVTIISSGVLRYTVTYLSGRIYKACLFMIRLIKVLLIF